MATVIRRATAAPPAKIHYLANSSVVDGGANVFDAFVSNDGGSAVVRLVKTSPTGGTVDLPPVYGPENSKVDGVTLVQSGRDLHVRMTSHVGDQNTMLSVEVLQGACVPYPGNPQMGMAGAFVPSGAPEPDPTPAYTLDEIAAAVKAALQADFTRIIGNMKPKAAAAVIETLRAGGDDDVYQQLVNTSYTGALGAIRDAGTPHAPELGAATETLVEGE